MNITEKSPASIPITSDADLRHPIACTITLHPDIYGLDFQNQYAISFKPIMNVLHKRKIKFDYCIELTKDVQIHYHLQIYQGDWSKDVKHWDNLIYYLRNAFRHLKYVNKIIGFLYFKKCWNDGWSTYCKKNDSQMEEWFRMMGMSVEWSLVKNNHNHIITQETN